jgi:UrcA family protein
MMKSLAALSAIALLSAPAFADTVPTLSLRIDKSALSTAQGAAQVHRQLFIEASDACRKGPPSAQTWVDTKCRDGLIDTAVKRINSPLLTAAHKGRTQLASN